MPRGMHKIPKDTGIQKNQDKIYINGYNDEEKSRK